MKNSKKALIVGICAAILLLAALAAILLTQCTTGSPAATEGTTTAAATEPTVDKPVSADIYWNLDRALYDGKSEAGMSSRMPDEEGFFHIRFFKDGQVITLRAANRKVVNSIDTNDLMGLTFDENGIIAAMIPLEDLPCQIAAKNFYVQSAAATLLKANSSPSMVGLEVLLELTDQTGIWDMTGMSGEPGCEATPIQMDRIIAVADTQGVVTHVFIYDRPTYMRTHEAFCQHCQAEVTWNEWTKENYLPTNGGHYQLMNDIQLVGQNSIAEDSKICLDLNGKTVTGKEASRMYSLHNPSVDLALMDTSEAKTGTFLASGSCSSQGMCVWVRYGAFYLYDGILNAKDAVSKSSGIAVYVAKGAFMYMYGGEIIGGKATYSYNQETGKYGAGLGGALYVAGKLVIHDGIIRDGRAEAKITAYNADGTPKTYQRGLGGNLLIAGTGLVEMNGGTIQNGKSDNSGGNIYIDGAGELILNGGTITGGRILGRSKSGGNIAASSKSVITINGGTVQNGRATYRAGNIATSGTLVINGGSIRDGKLTDYSTGKELANQSSRNIYFYNGYMGFFGGTVDGGLLVADTDAKTPSAMLVLSGYATVDSKTAPNLTLSTGGNSVSVTVGKLNDRARIGVTTTAGLFTQPTDQANLDSFYSDIAGAEVLYMEGRLGLGRLSCLCGSNSKNADDHLGDCKAAGIQTLFWGPVTSATSLPATTGNYYLLGDVNCAAQTSLAADAAVKLDLNGFTVTGPEGFRTISVHNPGASLVICDSSAGKTGVVRSHGTGSSQGNVVWTRYGSFDLYGGTLDGSAYNHTNGWTSGADGIYGTADDKASGRDGGALCMQANTKMRMFGGTVIGNNAGAFTLTQTVDGKEVSFASTSPNGATLYIPQNATFELYGGTITGGICDAYGGNIRLAGSMLIDGGSVSDGVCKLNGGNINITGTGVLELRSGSITGGWGKNVTGNIHNSGLVIMSGGSVTGGNAGKSGSATAYHADMQLVNGDWEFTGGVIGNVQILNYNTQGTEGGCLVTVSGSAAAHVLRLTTLDDKADDGKTPALPVLNICGALSPVSPITISTTEPDADFALGSDYSVTPQDGAAFTLSGSEETAAANPTTNSLFFGKYSCLCGGNSHSKGCQDLWKGEAKRWTPWTSETTLPISGGNYYLTGNVILSKVQNLKANANVVLDLNGKTVTGSANDRMYATFNSGSNLTITDNSAAQTGAMVGRLQANGIKSCCIWVRYGTFNLLGGTLDGSQAVMGNTWDNNKVAEKNGGVISAESSRTVNIYGGTVIGVTAKTVTIDEHEVYAPNGAAICAGTLNMYGGTVKDGSTEHYGGNIYVIKTANLYGGTVSGGNAENGGNIYIPADATLNIHEGAVIEGGITTAYGGNIYASGAIVMDGGTVRTGTATLNGGNINLTNSGTLVLSGGSITGGWGKNVTGNIHCMGVLTMTGGSVTGGKAGKNGSVTAAHADMQFVNGNWDFSGGETGYVQLMNLNTDGAEGGCIVNLSGAMQVKAIRLTCLDEKPDDGKTPVQPVLNITGALTGQAGSVKLTALALGTAAIGKDYTLTEADAAVFMGGAAGDFAETAVVKEADSLVLYGFDCLCGQETHSKGCLDLWNGEKQVWKAWTSTTTLPTASGNYYLTENVTLTGGVQKLKTNANVVLDLNGKTVTGKANDRMYATHNTDSNLTITDKSQAQTGKLVGTGTDFSGKSCCIWVRYGTFNLLGGTLDGSQTSIHNGWENGKQAEKNGGVICMESNRTVNIYGGTVIGAKAVNATVSGQSLYAPMGASIYVPSGATLNMYGGTVKGGSTDKNGGNIYLKKGTLNLYGGVIEGGEAKDSAGNLFVNGGTVNMSGGIIRNGTRNGSAANMTANCGFINGGILNMTGGEIYGRTSVGSKVLDADTKTGTVNISGSAKIHTPTAANPVSTNNLSSALTINIGKLNDDAAIGFHISASVSKPLTSDKSNPKLLATFTDEESVKKALDEGRIGISVYIANDTHKRTYAFVVSDGKLYVYQASATPK